MDSAIAIIGAGPYALATAAHLRRHNVDPLVFGRVMGAWERMPRGMLLRSFRESTSIGDPARHLTIDEFARERGRRVETPVPVEDFVEYGRWFQQQTIPAPEERFVRALDQDAEGFRLVLDDGAEVTARRVVVAAGIAPFARLPEGLEPELVTHSSAHVDFDAFSGRRLLVLGGGQSALECAALAHEAGAGVEVVTRRPLRFLRGERVHDRAGPFRAVLYPSWGVGPPGLNWLMGRPGAYRLLPGRTAETLAARSIRPAGAAWLRARLEPVVVTGGTSVRQVAREDSALRVLLEDGSERRADNLIAATGYDVDISRYPFLAAPLLARIARSNGFPSLNRGYESSVRGLYFVGAPAAASMGPGMRFVSHSGMAAAAVAHHVSRAGRRP